MDFTPAELEAEEWRAVVGHPAYQVSNLGRVRRFHRSRGEYGPPLQPYLGRAGYPMVSLFRDSVGQPRKVHHLVLEAFIGPRPSGTVGAHIDDVRTNSRLVNLRWSTPLENYADSVRNGARVRPCGSEGRRGEACATAKLSRDAVAQIRVAATTETVTVLARRWGVSRRSIRRVLVGETWAEGV